MSTGNTENFFQIWVNGGGLSHHGVHQQMVTAQQVPLFLLRAASAAAIATAVSVFAQFVSFLLQSLNQEMITDGK